MEQNKTMKDDLINYTRKESFNSKSARNGYVNPVFQHDGNTEQNDELQKIYRKKNEKSMTERVGILKLFVYADWLEIILMIIGLTAAVVNGIVQPLRIVVLGEMVDNIVLSEKNLISVNLSMLVNGSTYPAVPDFDIEAEMTKFAYYFVGLGFSALILGTIQVWTFFTSAERQIARIRQKAFFAVLHQDMAWFDTIQIGTLNSRLTDDINIIHGGIGENICIFVQFFVMFLTGIIIGFIYGWKLTLVILSVCPLLFAAIAVKSLALESFTTEELATYASAGAVAEEMLTAIRTVVAFNGQMKALAKYNVNLENARSIGVNKSIIIYTSMGFIHFFLFGIHALTFWYGAKLTVEEKEIYNIGRVLIIFLSVLSSTVALGWISPNLESVANAQAAAYEVYKIINKHRLIDSSAKEGYRPEKVKGEIEFKNIHFSYPSRPDVKILRGLNLKVQSGKTIALVGSSGCGKSTTIQLLQRFYDPDQGEITLDGQDIRTLNVKWLRENIGLVSQEPVLFATTIAENIRYGREDVTDSEIEEAAKEANAFDFISALPEKFNTVVGERGAQLSGGQRQRIAIARALARNPKILLLDEATSALDTQNESVVQAALDKARAGRTTIVIAHRLSTIRTADIIAGFHKGAVIELGTHNELMAQKGVYYSLVMKQAHGENAQNEPSEEDGTKEEDYGELDLDDLLKENLTDVGVFEEAGILQTGIIPQRSNSHERIRTSSKKISPENKKKTAEKEGHGGKTQNEVSKEDEETEDEDYEEEDVDDLLKENLTDLGGFEEADIIDMGNIPKRSQRHKSKKTSSKKSSLEKKKTEEKQEEDLPAVPYSRIIALNKPEWLYIVFGVIAAAFCSGLCPITCIMYGKFIAIFKETDPEERSKTTMLFCLILLLLGVIILVTYVIQGFLFGVSEEILMKRLRSLSFKAMLQQEIGWYDDQKNAIGVLLSRLATDVAQIKGATGSQLGFLSRTVCVILTGIIIGFVYDWRLSLLNLACFPFLITANAIKIRMKCESNHAWADHKALEEARRISVEAVENIRTVASLTSENAFYERYNASLNGAYRDCLTQATLYGLSHGIAECVTCFLNAAAFQFGAWLIANYYTNFENVFITFNAFLFSCINIWQSSNLTSDFGKAKVSAQRLFQLLDRKPLIDSYSEEGTKLMHFDGDIEFRDVHFAYPARPDVQVFQGLNLKVNKRQTLALVGSSGCGKSTAIQLLERFHDPVAGQVFADGFDTKSLHLQWLRSKMAIVSQEPILFDCSIAENIQYGDNSNIVTQEEVEEAAKAANIHTFIENLPEKYNTQVGDKGAQLSGGQKQRIAIARALVRKPAVLLLDEATSALDTESEKIVQKALDNARKGRTCIIIAHRLTTVQNADVIAVIHKGKVVEQGTHSQLLAKEGHYYALVNAQVSH